MRCHSWGCTYCAPQLAKRWVRTLETCEFRPQTFATLTIDPAKLERLCGCAGCIDPEDERPAWCLLYDYGRQHALFMRQWRQLLQALRRIAKRERTQLSYFRATEHHAGNWDARRRVNNHREHWHLLLNLDLGGGFRRASDAPPGGSLYSPDKDRFAQLAERFGFGLTRAYTIDPSSRLVRSYVSKYASKGSTGNYLRIRHISTSQDIQHPQHESDPCLDFAIVSGADAPRTEDLARTLPSVARAYLGCNAVLARVRSRFPGSQMDGDSYERPIPKWLAVTARLARLGDPCDSRLPGTVDYVTGAVTYHPEERNQHRRLTDARTIEHARLTLETLDLVVERTEHPQTSRN